MRTHLRGYGHPPPVVAQVEQQRAPVVREGSRRASVKLFGSKSEHELKRRIGVGLPSYVSESLTARCTSILIACRDRATISGDGRTFKAAAGWVVREGARRGDYEVVRQQP
jgi:hypothetical protein